MAADLYRWIDHEAVTSQLEAVEQIISDVGNRSRQLHYQLFSPQSKRLRPALLLLSAQFGPRPTSDLLTQSAAAIELLHQGSLYHDDIVDEAAWRRGWPPVYRMLGADIAALGGTQLFYAATRLILNLPSEPLTRLVRTADELCRGQSRELQALGKVSMSLLERLRIMRLKTASIFELATRLGAVLSGAPLSGYRRLSRIGIRFGLSYQLADDLRDIFAAEDLLGRPPGSDIRDGVYTLPVLFALDAHTDESRMLRACLQRLQRTPESALVGQAIDSVRRSGGGSRSLRVLDAWVDTIGRDLKPLSDAYGSEAVAPFRQLLRWLRDYVEPQIGYAA
jgi:heptaprenyl diphosphate synthase